MDLWKLSQSHPTDTLCQVECPVNKNMVVLGELRDRSSGRNMIETHISNMSKEGLPSICKKQRKRCAHLGMQLARSAIDGLVCGHERLRNAYCRVVVFMENHILSDSFNGYLSRLVGMLIAIHSVRQKQKCSPVAQGNMNSLIPTGLMEAPCLCFNLHGLYCEIPFHT